MPDPPRGPVPTSRQIEMLWACSSCGARNRGRDSVCPTCGNPKGPDEPWILPDDTAAAPTVTDPALLRKAVAGPHWLCASCGSQVPADEHRCTQCAAPRGDAVVRPGTPPPLVTPATNAGCARAGVIVAAVLGVPMVALVLCCGVLGAFLPKPHDVDAVVTAHHWAVAVDVDRWALRTHEGFSEDVPEGALHVKRIGRHHHHDDQVPDGTHTEHYTEEVPDGTRTEHYTERVACGEDCTPIPERCHEVCTPNDNGFATCTEECSGGGEDCTTRYCREDRTREIPQTRTVHRTRTVQDYRAVPRDAPWYRWQAWDWAFDRKVEAEGVTDVPAWPSTAPPAPLADGEQEREARHGSFDVVLTTAEGKQVPLHLDDEAAFLRLPTGSHHTVHVDGKGEHGALVEAAAPPPPR